MKSQVLHAVSCNLKLITLESERLNSFQHSRGSIDRSREMANWKYERTWVIANTAYQYPHFHIVERKLGRPLPNPLMSSVNTPGSLSIKHHSPAPAILKIFFSERQPITHKSLLHVRSVWSAARNQDGGSLLFVRRSKKAYNFAMVRWNGSCSVLIGL